MKSSDGSWRNAAVLFVVFVVLILAGCAQHEAMPTAEETANTDQHLPFEAASDKGGIFPTGSLTPTAIPAGTPLSVRLRTPLSSATSRPGDSFEAVLDEPIVVHGKVVAPRGANVTGKVLDAQAAGELQESGYMRLALTAFSFNGQSFPIQTSSIFVKRNSRHEQSSTLLPRTPIGGKPVDTVLISKVSSSGLGGSLQGTVVGASTSTGIGADHTNESKDVGVSAERRLTFRLAQPLPLAM
jgi:hypothetical protein